MLNALTIDLEDYFQVHAFSNAVRFEDWGNYPSRIEHNTHRLLNILDSSFRNRVTATFFVLGWIAERYPSLIRTIKRESHEIACHGYSHKLIYTQSREEFRGDVRKAKALLEDITGDEVFGYRAPSYSITKKSQWAFEVLIEEGFKYDSSIFPIHHDFYGFPQAPRFPFLISMNGSNNYEFQTLSFYSSFESNNSTNSSNPSNSAIPNSELRTLNCLLEIPISTVRICGQNFPISGGGYFRLFPYSIIRKALARINRLEGKPFIFYLHPWELDPNQPRMRTISGKSKFRHYVNLHKTESKFKKLLLDFRFSAISDLLNSSTAALNNNAITQRINLMDLFGKIEFAENYNYKALRLRK